MLINLGYNDGLRLALARYFAEELPGTTFQVTTALTFATSPVKEKSFWTFSPSALTLAGLSTKIIPRKAFDGEAVTCTRIFVPPGTWVAFLDFFALALASVIIEKLSFWTLLRNAAFNAITFLKVEFVPYWAISRFAFALTALTVEYVTVWTVVDTAFTLASVFIKSKTVWTLLDLAFTETTLRVEGVTSGTFLFYTLTVT